MGGTTWFPIEERLRKWDWDFESTVAGCEPVELSRRCGGSFTCEDLVTSTALRQVLKRLQMKAGSSMATDGKTGQHVNVHSLYIPEKRWCVRKNDDTPRPSRPSDPDRPGSLQKISRSSAFSLTVLEEQLLALTNPSGMKDTRCKVRLALRLAECCNAEEFMSESLDSRSVSLSRGIPEKSGRSRQTRRLRGFESFVASWMNRR